MSTASEEPRIPRTQVRFSFTTALAVVAAVVAALILSQVVSAASKPLGWALACAVVAALLLPILDFLDRHMPHALAVILTLLGVAIVLGSAWVGVAATFADEIDHLKEEAPVAAAEIEAESEVARDFGLEERVTDFVGGKLDERLGTRAQLERSASTVSTYVVTGVLVLFLIGYGRKMVAGGLNQIDDLDLRSRVEAIGATAVRNWTGYVWVAIGEILAVTLSAWLVLWLLDLPAPFILAILIGAFTAVPYTGTLLGGLPALLFAAATTDLWRVGVVLALIIALQCVEIFVIRRKADPATLHVGPALPLIVALIGWELYGLGGVIYGVILLVLALAIADAVDVVDAGDASNVAAAGGT